MKISSSFTIDNGVPLPRSVQYPFPDMAVGDSFAFELRDYSRVSSAAHNYAVRHDQKFRVSKTHLRCWRIS